jgi:hypothetical protein
MRTVLCTTRAGHVAMSNHRLCAERVMLRDLCRRARVRGAQPHAIVRWVLRHTGGWEVSRHTADGARGVSLPCVLCRRALDDFHVRWTATTRAGDLVDERTAPRSQPTSRQARFVFS